MGERALHEELPLDVRRGDGRVEPPLVASCSALTDSSGKYSTPQPQATTVRSRSMSASCSASRVGRLTSSASMRAR